jgi:hypothetical protein
MMMLAQLSIMFLMKHQVMLSMLFLNLALSIKIGVAFWLPGYLLILAKARGIQCAGFFVLFAFAFQWSIAYPFL